MFIGPPPSKSPTNSCGSKVPRHLCCDKRIASDTATNVNGSANEARFVYYRLFGRVLLYTSHITRFRCADACF